MSPERLIEVRGKIKARIDGRLRFIEKAIREHRKHVDRFEECCSKGDALLVELAEAHLQDAYLIEECILHVYGELNILRRALED